MFNVSVPEASTAIFPVDKSPWAPPFRFIFCPKSLLICVPLSSVYVIGFAATAYNWEPLTASVELAETSPAATFLICLSLSLLPTDNCA